MQKLRRKSFFRRNKIEYQETRKLAGVDATSFVVSLLWYDGNFELTRAHGKKTKKHVGVKESGEGMWQGVRVGNRKKDTK